MYAENNTLSMRDICRSFLERIMGHKFKIGLIRAQELFIERGQFSLGVGAFFSKIRNLGSNQSCLYNCLYKEINGLQSKL